MDVLDGFGAEFFLFAFHAHGVELALFGTLHDVGLDLGCRFLELRGELTTVRKAVAGKSGGQLKAKFKFPG